MKIIQEIKKALWTRYQTSTLYTVDKIPFHLDKNTPQSDTYPLIGVFHISSGLSMAMPSPDEGNTTGWDYSDGRWQFSCWANDRGHVELEDIADRLEDLYHRQPLILGNNCTHIATISYNNNTTFYDDNVKVWGIHLQFRIIAGR
jgi:hypothetical protein